MAAAPLPLDAVIGFGGTVPAGLILDPTGNIMIYPLGSTIVLREKGNVKSQEFLQGHTDRISCMAISPSGNFLASGQITYMGFAADIIIWDLPGRRLLHRMGLHKVKVQALSFSCDDRYLASLGGQDDNNLVVWNVDTGKAVCGSPTANDHVLAVKFFRRDPRKIVTGGNYNLNVWDFDADNRKVRPNGCHLGQVRRVCNTLVVDDKDEFVYVGTHTGDVLQVSLGPRLFKNNGPKAFIGMGVLSSCSTPTGDLLLGGGDGSITLVRADTLRSVCSVKLQSVVTSVTVTPGAVAPDGSFGFYAGTSQCNIYFIKYDGKENMMLPELVQTCHAEHINDVAFPTGYSEVFATCSHNDIRIWHAYECRELLRVQVANVECLCVAFMEDGKSVLSGWADGKIRAFGPQSGKLLYVINDAHTQGVTAICGTASCDRIVSGGKEGQVRVWRIGRDSQSMIASMKEHKGPVNSIQVRRNDSECVSASSDGSCIIWDLTRFVRNNSLFASTFFKAILYHPDESQLLTTGTDRKITYWDAYDGQAIRILDGSMTAEMNALAISPDGVSFVSGGADKEVKLWGYDEGHCYFIGRGHSGAINKVKISPDQRKIVSVGEEGAILIWDYRQLRANSATY